jgi:hypothetical protein
MGFCPRSSTAVGGADPVHDPVRIRVGRSLVVGAAWWAGRLERLVRNVDGRQDGRNDDGCPRWCAGEHDELEPAGQRLHRSPARSLPVVVWPGGDDAEAATVHLSVCRAGDAGEDRLRLESDGLGALDLDLSSAARLARAVPALLDALR